MKRFGLILLVSCLCSESLFSQSFYAVRERRSIIGSFGTGTSTYYGDLSNPGTLVNYHPNINVGLQLFLTDRISARAELNWFQLQGSDATANEFGRKIRNLSFKSNCFEITTTASISLYSNGNRHYRRPFFNVYAFGGLGLLYFNPTAEYKGQTYSLQPLKTEGVSYGLIVPVIPLGIGARIKIGPHTNLVVEGGYRKTFTDYLDDVSSKYVNNNSFTDPIAKSLADRSQEIDPAYPLASAGAKRGEPSNTDSYFLLNTKIEYYLPWDTRRRGNGLISKRSNRSMYRYRKGGGLKRPKKFLFF
jgi:hypothetical protein